MTAAFLIGQYAIGNAQLAVMATFTAAAVLGIADFTGDRSGRMRAAVSTLVVGAALLALGTAVSSNTAAATATMFVVTLVVAYSAVFSGYFAAASSAVVVFYVVATGFPGPVSSIPAREAGLALGGAMSVLAIGWLWPSGVAAESRRALADVYRLLSRAVAGLGGDGNSRNPTVTGEELDSAILKAEQAIARSAWRPDGLAGPHKARMYLLQGARRMRGVVTALAPDERDVVGPADEAHLEGSLAAALDACADAMVGGPLPDPEPVEAATDEFASAARTGFAARAASDAAPADLRTMAAETFLLHQLGWGVVLAVLHTRAMFNAPVGEPGTAGRSWLVGVLFDGPSVRKWVRRARRNLTPRSVHFQNSLRLAAGLALARLAVGVFDLKHGFWVGFATLVVLKTSAAGTRSTAVQAAAGTAIGFAVSSIFIASFGVHDVVFAALLPVVTFAAFYLPGAMSFVAGQACFTLVIVVLFNLVKPAGWSVGLLRLEDVLIGAGIGLVIGMAIWPRGASRELRRGVGSLFESGGVAAAATLEALVRLRAAFETEPDGRPAFVHEVQAAAFDVEDVFSQYLAEPHQSDAPVMDWAGVIASAHRLWFGAAVCALVPPLSPECRPSTAITESVHLAAGTLEEDYRRIGTTLDQGAPLELDPIPGLVLPEGHVRGSTEEMLTLLEAQTWLDEMSAGFDGLLAAFARLRITPPESPRAIAAPSSAVMAR